MIKIGEFARLCQVTIPTIRHYEELGLLTPCMVDSATGYRYYSVSQMPRLNRILALKDLGFTLHQIDNVLNSELPLDELRGMLKLKHAEVEQQLAAEQARLDRILARLKQIGEENSMSEFEVALKTLPPMLVATCTVTIPANDQVPEYLGSAFREVSKHIAAHGAKAVGPCCALWHQGSEVLENEIAEAAIPIDRAVPGTEAVKVYEIPAGKVASVLHHGGFDGLPRMHRALHRWMEDASYQPAASYREIYINTEDPANAVLEVQYPISAG
ncbi:MAG TPA: GyrI-like domain-containing protein [Chthonomonadales bacterium]|nr:GyrI-like domain-containing protein [Chthonomonadales bacterium]